MNSLRILFWPFLRGMKFIVVCFPLYKVLKIVSVAQCFMQLPCATTIFSFVTQRLTNTLVSEQRAKMMFTDADSALFLCFSETGSQYTALGCLGSHRDLSASASRIPSLKECTTPSFKTSI